MAKAGRGGLQKKESSLMFREISPPHKWDQDLHSHFLRLTLPGFTSSDITIHMNKYGHLVVRGSREVSPHKHLSFEETFDVPDDAKLEHAEGLFQDDHIYCVTIPKTKLTAGRSGDHAGGGLKLEHPNKDHSICPKPGAPSPLVSMHNSKNKIAFAIAILLAIYVAWLRN